MDVNSCYLFLQFLARKNQVASIKPSEFQYAYNTAQRQYMDFLIGRVEQFQYGDATPRVGLGMNSKIATNLSPFKVDGVSISVSSQIALYPSDFQYLAVMKDTFGRKIERIDDSKLPARLTSVIDPMSDSSKSFYVEGSTGWTIYPNTVTTVVVNYYKTPPNVIWGYYTSGGRGVFTFFSQTITGGSGYVNGTYTNVPMTGGSGTGLTANITVSGNAVTAISVVNYGKGYVAGDTVSASNTNLGGSGSGFSVAIVSTNPLWDDTTNEDILGRAARILGLSFTSQNLVQYGEEVISRGE